MPYRALATDYDATLATEGVVTASTALALHELRRAGFRQVLVTGRRLDDLQDVFPGAAEFDAVVAENGAILWQAPRPARLLAAAPPPGLTERLRSRGIPFVAGQVVVASWDPYGPAVRQAIAELGLPLEIVLNKEAVMVLPPGVDKGSGLSAALAAIGVAAAEVVAIGDAENDEVMLGLAGCAVAVANALPSVRAKADLVTAGERGAGVEELVRRLLAGELPPARAGTVR